MSNNGKAAIVLGAGAAAVAAALALGVIPNSPKNSECWRALAVGPCTLAKSLAADPAEIDCVDGEATVPVEIVLDAGATEAPTAQLPEGVTAIDGSAHQVDCAKARRPAKVVTARAPPDDEEQCIAGLVSRDTSEHGDGSRWRTWTEPHTCCGDRCRCDSPPCVRVPSVHIAGRETWRARVCERRPELCPGQGGP